MPINLAIAIACLCVFGLAVCCLSLIQMSKRRHTAQTHTFDDFMAETRRKNLQVVQRRNRL